MNRMLSIESLITGDIELRDLDLQTSAVQFFLSLSVACWPDLEWFTWKWPVIRSGELIMSRKMILQLLFIGIHLNYEVVGAEYEEKD